jgi:hypothetical protein
MVALIISGLLLLLASDFLGLRSRDNIRVSVDGVHLVSPNGKETTYPWTSPFRISIRDVRNRPHDFRHGVSGIYLMMVPSHGHGVVWIDEQTIDSIVNTAVAQGLVARTFKSEVVNLRTNWIERRTLLCSPKYWNFIETYIKKTGRVPWKFL